jgi:glutathione peroxidase
MAGPERKIYEFSAPLLDGRPVSLEAYRGRVLLIVNTASKCGFTPEYAGLEELYRAYKDRGFAVLGFPCNQFGRQEPGAAQEIGAFCETQGSRHVNMFTGFQLYQKVYLGTKFPIVRHGGPPLNPRECNLLKYELDLLPLS